MRRTSALVAVFVLLVVSSGCLGQSPDRSDPGEQTLADAQTALDAVQTYHYETEMHVSATAEGETLEHDVSIAGEVDVTEQLAVSRIRMEGENHTSYVTGQRVFRACGGPWGWGNESLDVEGDWVTATPVGRQLQLLESGDLRVEPARSLPEEDAVVLVGHPSPKALERYGVSATQPVFGGPSVQDITVRVVVDDQSHRPLRSSVDFDIAGGGGVGNGSIDTTFSAFDEPVSIEVPDEVREDAWETGCPGS